MPPTRPPTVDSTPRFRRAASSGGAGGALVVASSTLLVTRTSGAKGGTGMSPAPALQASFGPGQNTRHGNF